MTLWKLHLWHVVLLATLPVLLALFKLSSEPHDDARAAIETIAYILGGAWLAFVLIHAARRGRSDEALPSALNLYRELLGVVPMAIAANLAGTAMTLMLVYQLLAFRQVEFVSPRAVAIYLHDQPGTDDRLGYLKADVPTLFRLPVGTRRVVYRELSSGNIVGSDRLEVETVFTRIRPLRAVVRVSKEAPRDGKLE